MKLVLDTIDEISPTVLNLLRNNKTTLRRATKSVGWWIQHETKIETKRGAPGGVSFKNRAPYKKVRKPLGDGHAPTSWYGKMRNAIGYSYNNGVLDVGWTSKTSAYYANIQEYGAKRQVTDNVRKKYFAVGVPLHKDVINIPERPIFEPMAYELFPKLPEYVEEKVLSYMAKDVEFGKKKSRRKYKVYDL